MIKKKFKMNIEEFKQEIREQITERKTSERDNIIIFKYSESLILSIHSDNNKRKNVITINGIDINHFNIDGLEHILNLLIYRNGNINTNIKVTI